MSNNIISTFIDPRDGITYKTVKIGNQIWMAENLIYKAGEGCWCYDDNETNAAKYGRLYDWETAMKVVPLGWHLPTKKEFEILLTNFGGDGENAFQQLIPGGSSGFDARFGGWLDDGCFGGLGLGVNFWSATEDDASNAWSLYVYGTYQAADIDCDGKNNAFSVRLLKD